MGFGVWCVGFWVEGFEFGGLGCGAWCLVFGIVGCGRGGILFRFSRWTEGLHPAEAPAHSTGQEMPLTSEKNEAPRNPKAGWSVQGQKHARFDRGVLTSVAPSLALLHMSAPVPVFDIPRLQRQVRTSPAGQEMTPPLTDLLQTFQGLELRPLQRIEGLELRGFDLRTKSFGCGDHRA